jgi:hypothetical protein
VDLSSYGVKGAVANESILASFQNQIDPTSSLSCLGWGHPVRLLTLMAWLSWHGSPRFERSPKSQISSTCKSTQIHITSKNNTNSTRTKYTAVHILHSNQTLADEMVWPAGSGKLCPEHSLHLACLNSYSLSGPGF